MDTNVLYYGDNLDILRRYLPDATVDLSTSTPIPYAPLVACESSEGAYSPSFRPSPEEIA